MLACPRPTGMVRALNIIPPGGFVTKEPMWTFHVDCVTQNNRSS